MTYDPTLATPTDRIRFAVQDTSDTAPIIAEATVTALYTYHDDSEARATVAVAEAMILRISQDPDKLEITGALKVEWANRLGVLRALANGLRSELGLPVQGTTDNTMRVGYLIRSTADSSEFAG
jgi:hypothetical protein